MSVVKDVLGVSYYSRVSVLQSLVAGSPPCDFQDGSVLSLAREPAAIYRTILPLNSCIYSSEIHPHHHEV